MLKTKQQKQSGMSLIEVVIAIAISGFILASAASFVVSITDIWSKREQRYAFFEHADGVSQFLKTNFRSAQIIPSEDNSLQNSTNVQATQTNPSIQANSGSISIQTNTQSSQNTGNENDLDNEPQSDTNLFWQSPEFNQSSDEPILSFQIRETTPLLTSSKGVMPVENTLYLYFEPDEGLSLVHTSSLNETIESDDDYHRTMLSPFVKDMQYIYWDIETETWESLDEPMVSPDDEFTYLIPNFLKLSFKHKETEIERIIPIPKHSKHLILY
jgi:prepilin-type N-terminal cleavage/methylation domain-containing protein